MGFICIESNAIQMCIQMCIHRCLCSGSSGSVRYDSLSPGTYTLRIVARAANGEREIERRKIYIGRYGVEAPSLYLHPP